VDGPFLKYHRYISAASISHRGPQQENKDDLTSTTSILIIRVDIISIKFNQIKLDVDEYERGQRQKASTFLSVLIFYHRRRYAL